MFLKKSGILAKFFLISQIFYRFSSEFHRDPGMIEVNNILLGISRN